MEGPRRSGRACSHAAGRPAGDDPLAGLTHREREVLRLVAADATDREIAAALAIRPRTVEWHVTDPLRKLRSGTRIAAHSIRHGLD